MRLKDCYEKGLLRKRKPDKLKSERAMELAGSDLERAKKLLENDFYMESIILSYTAMFKAASAILFRDGIFERSHVCVIEYLKEKYLKKHLIEMNYINWLDSLRVDRHESLYGLEPDESTRDEAEDAYAKAQKFIDKINEIIK